SGMMVDYMRFLPKRYLEEFFLYSSQFVLFFIIILFTSPAIIRPSTSALISLIVFLLLQIALLARFGHRPPARFFFSLMTPLGYTTILTLSKSAQGIDMASFFLWATSLYLGGIQALAILFRRKWPKRIAEIFLSLGTILSFIFFYFYLDLRLTSTKAYEAGELGYAALVSSLKLSNFGPAFGEFAKTLQHVFFMFGAVMFGSFQVADKIKQVSMKARLDQVYSIVEPPSAEPSMFDQVSDGENREVVILYADLWNFTPIAEKEGARATIGLLNRYYALWDIVARKHGGVVEQFVGDTAIVVFGLMGEKDAADQAVSCAFDFLYEFSHLQEDLAAHRLPLVKHIGIGVHAGKVAVGELSSASGVQRVGVVGEAVNIAARLDSLCREFKQDLLISQPVYKQLSLKPQSRFQPMGEVLFRGKTQPQAVYGKK
ncbi:MAG TPA: adenylate/guanylate cyclase domain-containing protein, partial [Spirochaetales bacterium]|nr:adenylate/guanylate cyclase domain-containing protein [Spirochaetales bacterium]